MSAYSRAGHDRRKARAMESARPEPVDFGALAKEQTRILRRMRAFLAEVVRERAAGTWTPRTKAYHFLPRYHKGKVA
jgi:hypothetical protein